MNEDELIEGLKLQSRIAFEQAYYAYKDLIFRVICKKVNVVEDAEELLQDVYVKAFKKIYQFNGQSRFSTWLVKIAINASLNFLESIKTQKAIMVQPESEGELEEQDQETDVDLPTPEELIVQKEDKAILLKAFTRLPANQHTACKLFYLEGFAQLEIAEIMAMSLDAVQSLIQRGKTTLRSILRTHN